MGPRRLIRAAVLGTLMLALWGASAAPAAAASLSWLGPLNVSGDHPGALFGADDNPGYTQYASCAPGYCIASDGQQLYGTTDPTTAAWAQIAAPRLGGGAGPVPVALLPDDISCAAGLCAATIEAHKRLYFSYLANPGNAGSAWSTPVAVTADKTGFAALSCPSAGECLIFTGDGRLLSSADPTGGAASWSAGRLMARLGTGAAQPDPGLYCPATTLCFATDRSTRTYVSTEPTAGPSAWSPVPAPLKTASGDSEALPACASASLCAYLAADGSVYTSTTPAQAGSWVRQWRDPAASEPDYVSGSLTCPSAGLCLGIDFDGKLISSTDPTGGAGAWRLSTRPLPAPDATYQSTVQCETAGACMVWGADADNREIAVSASASPAAATSWRTRGIAKLPAGFTSLACANVNFCLAADAHGKVQVTTAPGGDGAWQVIPAPAKMAQIQCPGRPAAVACIGLSRGGRLYAHAAAAAGAWRGAGGPADVASITCVPDGACVALTRSRWVWTASSPGPGRWHRHGRLPAAASHSSWSLVCPRHDLCEASTLDPAGDGGPYAPSRPTLVSHNPFSARPRWQRGRGPAGPLRCFGPRIGAQIREAAGHVGAGVDGPTTTLWATGDIGVTGWHQLLWSGILSDAPPYPIDFTDVAHPAAGAWYVVTDAGQEFVGTPGKGCDILDGSIVGCGTR